MNIFICLRFNCWVSKKTIKLYVVKHCKEVTNNRTLLNDILCKVTAPESQHTVLV